MQANYVQRLRFTFSKTGPTRFIGHLDLARTLERALNRARLPVAYSQGYNPRPRMQLAAALPLGYTSECELADIWLAERVDPDRAREQMMSRMAPGIAIHRVWEVPLSAASLQASTVESTYVAAITEEIDEALLQERIAALLAAEKLMRRRRNKEYDLRPLILNIKLEKSADEALLLTTRLLLKSGQTGRPDEVLAALGLDPLAARIHRTQIVVEENEQFTGASAQSG